MQENVFSEKESLELISKMIQQTKKNMEVGSGNIFLYYGYSAFIISILVFLLVYFTSNMAWASLWFLMFLPSIIIQIKNAKEKPQVVTYTDKAIANTWIVISALFVLTITAILLFGWRIGTYNFMLMLPLSLLYAGIGTSITGVITKIKVLIYTPLIAFFTSVYMLVVLVSNGDITTSWHLYFGISFVVMMIIPGHIINRKTISQCSKN
jgi:hypothetical protein